MHFNNLMIIDVLYALYNLIIYFLLCNILYEKIGSLLIK